MLKDISGYEGLYAVNELGQVWSHEKISRVGVNGGMTKRGGHFLKMNRTKRTSHQRVFLTKQGKRKQFLVHRLVAKAFIPNPNNLPFVNHIDADPTNNCVDNLEWCTAAQNAKHAYNKGLITIPNQSGASNSNAKLCDNDVLEIRKLHKSIGNCSEIARQYNVNPKTINMIISGKRWSHVQEATV